MSTREYRFRAIGAAEAARDILSLAQAQTALARAEGRSYGAGGTRRATPGYDAHVRARTEHLREQARAERAAKQASERAARETAKSVDRAERDKTRAVEREMVKRQRAYVNEGRAAARRTQEQINAEHRAQRTAFAKHERMRQQYNRKQHVEQVAAMRRRETLTGAVGLSAAGLVIGAAAAGVGTAINAVRSREEVAILSRQLSTSGRRSGEAGIDPRLLAGEADAVVEQVRGTKAADVLRGSSAFTAATGDLAGARRHQKTFATVARATGASDEDIAKTGAVLSQKFGITDSATMQSTLAGLVDQGKMGAFEMGDMARFVTELGASGERFGLKGAGGVAQLGSLAQVARMSTGSGAEASTAAQAALRQLVAKSEDIRRLNGGKEVVFADKGRTRARDMNQVLAGTIGAAGGDLTKLQKVFGDEGIAGVSALIKRFNEAAEAAGKSASASERRAAGEQAVIAMLSELQSAQGSYADIVKDAATNTDTLTHTLEQSSERIQTALANELEGPLKELAKTLTPVAIPAIKLWARELGSAASALAAFAKRLGIELPEDKPTAETPWGVKQGQLASERAGIEARIKAGTATSEDKARLKAIGTEEAQLSKEHRVGEIRGRGKNFSGKLGAGEVENVKGQPVATPEAIEGRFGAPTVGGAIANALGGGFGFKLGTEKEMDWMGVARSPAAGLANGMSGGGFGIISELVSLLADPAAKQSQAASDIATSARALQGAAEAVGGIRVGGGSSALRPTSLDATTP